MNVVEEIGRVLEIEIEALQSVRRSLNAEFEKAVDVMSSCSGRVFVTGIGKSGMIANKIASDPDEHGYAGDIPARVGCDARRHRDCPDRGCRPGLE